MREETKDYVYEQPAPSTYDVEYGERERHTSMLASWSPAQIVALIIGIGITVLGFAAVARTGFDTDHIYALGLASSPVPTPETLGNYRLAWVRGYDYQDYLPNVQHFAEVQRRDGIVSMLTHNRADYYIDAQTEVDYVRNRAKDPSQLRSTHIAELPLYLCFAKTAKARSLMALFDQRMEQLVKSGELKPIFERWKQPYPFDSN